MATTLLFVVFLIGMDVQVTGAMTTATPAPSIRVFDLSSTCMAASVVNADPCGGTTYTIGYDSCEMSSKKDPYDAKLLYTAYATAQAVSYSIDIQRGDAAPTMLMKGDMSCDYQGVLNTFTKAICTNIQTRRRMESNSDHDKATTIYTRTFTSPLSPQTIPITAGAEKLPRSLVACPTLKAKEML